MIQVIQTNNTLVFIVSSENDLNVQVPFISAIKQAIENKVPVKNITLTYNGVYISNAKQTALQVKFKAIKDKAINDIKVDKSTGKSQETNLNLKRSEGESYTRYMDRLSRKAAKEFLQ